jgi:UDP-2,4-diacetamido-2,4,6-trideoxy-beta-L-altropyranose hydrolase
MNELSVLMVRADAGGTIGSGHVMRCLALAQAWMEAGGSATFVTTGLPAALDERLRGEGIEVVTIRDERELGSIAREREAAWVVIDGYAFGAADQRRIKDAGLRLLWMDDVGAAAPYCADLVLNQNLGAEAALYADRDGATQRLLGPRYVLLRAEFRRWRDWRRTFAQPAKKVLVTLGGADAENVTLRVIRALQQITLPELEAVVVIGPSNPHEALLEDAAGDTPHIRLQRNVTDMPALMAWADVAIAAGGSTAWELAFFGLTSVVIALAENQRANAERLGATGVAVNAGWYADLQEDALADAVAALLADEPRRMDMARRGRELVDGDGAVRVVARMRARMLALRPAASDDCRLLWEWANEPEVRASSFQSEPVPWDDHVAWFEKRLASAHSLLYVAMNGSDPAGQIRYEFDGDRATVSVSLASAHRGRGFGSEIIRLGSQQLFAASGVTAIDAYVRPENAASLYAFRKAGFIDAGTATVHGVEALHLTIVRGRT